MIGKRVSFGSAALLALMGAAQAQGPSRFDDPGGRYSVAVPAGWTATQLNSDAVQLSGGVPYVSVLVLPNDDPMVAIEAIARQTAGQWKGFTEARRGDTRMAGLTGKYVTYAGVNPRGVDAYLEMLGIFRGGNTYLLMMGAPKAQFTATKPAFDQIEQSFTLRAAAPAVTAAASEPPPEPAGAIGIPAPARAAASAAPAGNGYYRMKKVSVIDQQGFEKPLPAVSLLIPTDWQFQGDTKYAATYGGCHENTVQVSFRAASPDGAEIVEMYPSYVWMWADDAGTVQLLQSTGQQATRSGMRPCEILPAMTAGEYLRRMVIPKVRPNGRIVAVEAMPEETQQAQEQSRQLEQTAAGMGMPVRIRADAARARVQYSVNGQAVEEWFTAVTFSSGVRGPSFNMRTGQMGQTTYYTCGASSIMSMRVPQGQLEARERFFRIVRSTVQTEPEWNARVTQVLQNMAAADTKGAADRSAIIAQNGRDISNIIKQTNENKNRAQDRSAEKFDQYIRGVETYRNPSTGETFELSNQYAHAWVNGTNEYLLTDSANFNPNATLGGRWTEAVPVK